MRTFIIGDYRTGTGPANVTFEYLIRFPKGTLCQKARSKPARVIEIIFKTLISDIVLCSGYSGQNLVAIKFAHLFGRPLAYLMHGCVEHENAINGVPDEEMNRIERATIKGSDAVFAVSERFEKWLKERYPEEKDKIFHVLNGVDFPTGKVSAYDNKADIDEVNKTMPARNKSMIFSVGGGMPRKQIRIICEAIEKLNTFRRERGEQELFLVVTGAKGNDDEVIGRYPFVDNRGLVPKEELKQIYQESILFIQNSCFETFGLAPMEALSNRCSILLSDKIGAIEVIDGLKDEDIVYDDKDTNEICKKIQYLIDNPNGERLYNSIDKKAASWDARCDQLIERLQILNNHNEYK